MQTHRIHPQGSLLGSIYRFTDAAAIWVGWWLAAELTHWGGQEEFFAAAIAAIVCFYLVGEFSGMYRSWRGAHADREILCTLGTWVAALALLMVLAFITRWTGTYPRRTILAWAATTPLLAVTVRIAIRLVLRALRARGINSRNVAIVGINELSLALARDAEHSPELGLHLEGFYDDRPSERTGDVPEEVGRRVGDLTELVDKARRGKINLVYITFPMRAEDRIRSLLNQLSDTTASVYIVPDFFVFELLHSRWTSVGGLPVVSVFEHPFYGVDGLAKRTVDLVVSVALLILLAIPLAIIAVLVKMSSPGPVFFRQKRYGLDGQEILVWKFRSMRVCENGADVVQAKRNDPRVTPVGSILRKTSLDELPQLFNVVAGNMSLVGPRPHASAHNEQYRTMIQGYMLRHKVKPGITGLAQVNGWRGETDTLDKMEGRVECDHRYIREWSLLMDFRILVKTIFVVLSRQNAY